MTRHFRYLAGTFESQFTTRDKRELSSYASQARIQPEQRFILSDISEITVEEFDRIVTDRSGSHIWVDAPSEIELRYSDHEAEIDTCEGLLITGEPGKDLVQFIASKDNHHHGRLSGRAICKVFSHETKAPEPPEKKPPLPAADNTTVIHGHVSGTDIRLTDINTGGNTGALPDISGPASKRGCMPSLMPAPGSGGGCMPGGQPGCRQWGCGIIGLFFTLLMLAGLLRACMEQRTGMAPPPQIIHDTVYVEVKRVDTVQVLRIDTLVMIDSVKQMEYKTVTLPNVNFFTNSAKLTPSSISDIQKIAEYLNDNPEMTAVVIGHTDSIGNARKNLELSQQRAESVRNMIATLGVDESRVSAVGKGEAEPRADNSTEEGRLMNRRVEVRLFNSTKPNGKARSTPRSP